MLKEVGRICTRNKKCLLLLCNTCHEDGIKNDTNFWQLCCFFTFHTGFIDTSKVCSDLLGFIQSLLKILLFLSQLTVFQNYSDYTTKTDIRSLDSLHQAFSPTRRSSKILLRHSIFICLICTNRTLIGWTSLILRWHVTTTSSRLIIVSILGSNPEWVEWVPGLIVSNLGFQDVWNKHRLVIKASSWLQECSLL